MGERNDLVLATVEDQQRNVDAREMTVISRGCEMCPALTRKKRVVSLLTGLARGAFSPDKNQPLIRAPAEVVRLMCSYVSPSLSGVCSVSGLGWWSMRGSFQLGQ